MKKSNDFRMQGMCLSMMEMQRMCNTIMEADRMCKSIMCEPNGYYSFNNAV